MNPFKGLVAPHTAMAMLARYIVCSLAYSFDGDANRWNAIAALHGGLYALCLFLGLLYVAPAIVVLVGYYPTAYYIISICTSVSSLVWVSIPCCLLLPLSAKVSARRPTTCSSVIIILILNPVLYFLIQPALVWTTDRATMKGFAVAALIIACSTIVAAIARAPRLEGETRPARSPPFIEVDLTDMEREAFHERTGANLLFMRVGMTANGGLYGVWVARAA